jgi:hypothetical protein
MQLRAWHGLAVLATSLGGLTGMLGAGCAVSIRGELTSAECQNAKTDAQGSRTGDDDGDGLYDCEDPDCWVYDFCVDQKDTSLTVKDAAVATQPDGSAGTGSNQPGVDASTGSIDEDGGVLPVTDAGPTTMSGCDAASCMPEPLLPGDFRIVVKSGNVPAAIGYTTICYDDTCLSPPAGVCGCAVDPYVTVIVRTGGQMTMKSTPIVYDSTTPVWSSKDSNGFVVHLDQYSTVEFHVYDSDALEPSEGPDDPIFTCKPDLAGLEQSKLVCSPAAGTYPDASSLLIVADAVKEGMPQ